MANNLSEPCAHDSPQQGDNTQPHRCNSYGKGACHWWLQRGSAVLLVVACAWLSASLVSLYPFDHNALINYFAMPLPALLLAATILALIFHAYLGIEVIIDDYVHSPKCNCISKSLLLWVSVGLALVTIASAVKLIFSS